MISKGEVLYLVYKDNHHHHCIQFEEEIGLTVVFSRNVKRERW